MAMVQATTLLDAKGVIISAQSAPPPIMPMTGSGTRGMYTALSDLGSKVTDIGSVMLSLQSSGSMRAKGSMSDVVFANDIMTLLGPASPASQLDEFGGLIEGISHEYDVELRDLSKTDQDLITTLDDATRTVFDLMKYLEDLAKKILHIKLSTTPNFRVALKPWFVPGGLIATTLMAFDQFSHRHWSAHPGHDNPFNGTSSNTKPDDVKNRYEIFSKTGVNWNGFLLALLPFRSKNDLLPSSPWNDGSRFQYNIAVVWITEAQVAQAEAHPRFDNVWPCPEEDAVTFQDADIQCNSKCLDPI